MDKNSRTAKSLKNSAVAIVYYCITLILQFFSRKVFLDVLGTDILGLNSTATNLLQFLNLAELGITAAVGFTLYKPLFEKDENTINEIVSLQGHLYKRIAFLIILGAMILMLFFPLIFSKIQLPLWYAYASFSVLLLSSLLGYFVNYKQVVLTADQKDYKILYSYRTVMLFKVLFQMIAVYYLPNGYVWWLIVEALFAFLGSWSLYIVTKRTYPFLKSSALPYRQLRDKYPEFFTKVKQLVYHRIGYFALTQSSPLIIYGFTSLTVVALYGNYLIIISGVQMLVTAIFNSTSAGIGNLIAQGDNSRINIVFEQLFGIRFIIVSVLAIMTYFFAQSFMTLWVGAQYLLSIRTVILMVLIFYVNLFRYTIDSFLSAYGLFQDVWAPVVETILNIGLSVLLGSFWGLNGVLTGVLISLILVIAIWKPIFLFRNTNFSSLKNYLKIYIKHIIVLGIIFSFTCYIISHIFILNNYSWGKFILNALILFICFGALVTAGIAVINRPFLNFVRNIKRR